MNESIYKEVDFAQYCPTCKYAKQYETEEPCDRCLEESVNVYSHKPVEWKDKEE